MEYEVVDEYICEGYKIKVRRPILTEVERIERGKRVAKQLKRVVQEFRQEQLDAKQNT